MTIYLPKTPELLKIARRVVWFKEPENTLENPYHFMAYLMTYGFYEEIKVVKQYLKPEQFLEALDHAPPGIFDPRSWTYWNLVFHRDPAPPIPERNCDSHDLN